MPGILLLASLPSLGLQRVAQRQQFPSDSYSLGMNSGKPRLLTGGRVLLHNGSYSGQLIVMGEWAAMPLQVNSQQKQDDNGLF